MADSNLTGLTEDTTPLGTDLMYGVSGGTTDFKRYLGDLNLTPDGTMINGAISVTVASNNITVALKTKSGGNPSATDPVSVWINGAWRTCTAALSVTKNAGTQWFNLDSRFSAVEQDFFVYLIWNTTPATDIMDIGFARVPYFRLYSEASSTTTNEKYLAFGNASTPTSTDNLVNIGRFAATLSASASYNWSVPTFTNTNKIDEPTYESRVLSWTPAHSRTGGAYTNAPTQGTAEYQVIGRNIRLFELHTQNATPGSSGNQTFTIPFTNPLASGQPIISANGTSGAVLVGFLGGSNSTVSLFLYDGTAQCTASQIYITHGILRIG